MKDTDTNGKPEWRVPRNRIAEFHQSIRESLHDAMDEVFATPPLELVNIIYDCEKQFAAWAGFPFAVGVNSGTSALIVALRALGVMPGDEVITPANSDMADTNAVESIGAVPVFCDVKTSDFTLDPSKVESLITEKTRAVISVDLYGCPSDIPELRKITDKYGIKILEDASLGTFSEDYGQRTGYYADVVAFSTSATKLVHGLGYGGFVSSMDKDLENRCHMITEYGVDYALEKKERFCGIKYHTEIGLNVKMSPADAAAIRCKMKYFDDFRKRRKQVMKWYEQYLKDIPHIFQPEFRSSSDPCLREYVIRVVSSNGNDRELRNKLLAELSNNSVQCTTGFTPCYPKRIIGQTHIYPGADKIPVTEMLDGQTLTLPCDITTTEDDVLFIAEVIRKFMAAEQ